METLILIVLTVPLFFLRDVLLLHAGPPRKVGVRVVLYIGVLTSYVAAFFFLAQLRETGQIVGLIRSARGILCVILFHVALLVACFWLRRAEEHDLAWCVTLTPNPMFVLGVALAASVVAQHNSSFGVLSIRSILTIIWIVSVAAAVFWTRNMRLEADEVDFSLKYAGLINCAALVIPLECFLTD
jgi:hypothetical protein